MPKQPTKTASKDELQDKKEITVKIGAFPGGKITSYTLPTGSTYEAGLRQAQLIESKADIKNLDVRVNGQKISSLDAVMSDGEQILLFKQVRGN